MDLNLVLGDMLFDGLPGLPKHAPVLMVEDNFLCRRVRHHQQKIVLFLSSMRHFAERLRADGYAVRYFELEESRDCDIFERISKVVKERGIRRLHTYAVNDRFFESKLLALGKQLGIEIKQVPSPMFLTGKREWTQFRKTHQRLLMADFYQWQRKRLNLLLDCDGKPTGGQWSFDAENRKPLPKSIVPPAIWWPEPDCISRDVIKLVASEFADHPGCAAEFRWPTTHEEAREWLSSFLEERLDQFGDYEDAICQGETTLFHSLLTPMLNTGLLTPSQVVCLVLERHQRRPVPLNSLEGFIRQVIGWREFMKGVDSEVPQQAPSNYFNHHRQLKPCWFNGTTGLLPLDTAIQRARTHGWCHHIERLMVLGSAMLMCEVEPEASYNWFMEMFVDSADWVMSPNVLGMSQFADGGTFATKPYISGSNYIRKMSDYSAGEWCEIWDGLYWRFIQNHRDFFEKNPRMSVMVRGLDNLEPSRKVKNFAVAESFIERTTHVI